MHPLHCKCVKHTPCYAALSKMFQ